MVCLNLPEYSYLKDNHKDLIMDKIVVVGSLNYDIFVESPRRPLKGETLPAYRWYPKGGGKGGNQAISAAKNGCSVQFVGGVGNDSFADALIKNLEASCISVGS